MARSTRSATSKACTTRSKPRDLSRRALQWRPLPRRGSGRKPLPPAACPRPNAPALRTESWRRTSPIRAIPRSADRRPSANPRRRRGARPIPPRCAARGSRGALRKLAKPIAATASASKRGAERKAEADANLFRNEIGAIRPLNAPPRGGRRTPPDPVPKQTQRDEEAVLNATLSDELIPRRCSTATTRDYHRPGISRDVVRTQRRVDRAGADRPAWNAA